MLSTIVDIANIIASIGVIVGVFLAIAQLKKTAKIAEADHSRQRMQATIDFFDKIRDKTTPLMSEIKKVVGDNPVTIDQIDADPDLRSNVSQYLSLMERLSVGVNSQVYDYDIFRTLYGAVTVRAYYRLREYILHSRKQNGTNTIFEHFESLAKKLEVGRHAPLSNVQVKKP